jgi:phage gp16-like protein
MKKDNRNAALAQIHIGKKQLGLDDDTYRAMLTSTTGKSSCADMSLGELYKVIHHLKQCGLKSSSRKHGKRPNPGTANKALMNKVEALLADGGYHWNYAHSMAKRMFNVEKVDWLDRVQLHKLIAALEYNAKRKG